MSMTRSGTRRKTSFLVGFTARRLYITVRSHWDQRVRNQIVAQYWGGSDISVGDTNYGLVGRDNGAAASRKNHIRLADNMTR